MQCHMFGHVAGVESTIDIDGGIYVCRMCKYNICPQRICLGKTYSPAVTDSETVCLNKC